MKLFTTVSICCATLAALSVHAQVHAQASAAEDVTGPYIGAALGPAFGNREIDDSSSSNDEHIGRGAKLYGGYQLTENFGVQVGYVRMRELNRNTGSGATLNVQTATGHSTYVAGTGRLPLGQSFALTGKVGVSFGNLISEKAQQAHLVSLWAGKMVAPTQEVRHEDEPSAIPTRAVDA